MTNNNLSSFELDEFVFLFHFNTTPLDMWIRSSATSIRRPLGLISWLRKCNLKTGFSLYRFVVIAQFISEVILFCLVVDFACLVHWYEFESLVAELKLEKRLNSLWASGWSLLNFWIIKFSAVLSYTNANLSSVGLLCAVPILNWLILVSDVILTGFALAWSKYEKGWQTLSWIKNLSQVLYGMPSLLDYRS